MTKIIPKCLEDKGDHFVCAEGYWLPCCVIDGINKEYFKREEFDVVKFNNFHNNPLFLEWVNKNLTNFDTAPIGCKKKCNETKVDENKFYTSSDEAEFFF